MIQIQNGRLHFNWLGTEAGTYPRYETVRDGFAMAFQAFQKFVGQEKVGELRPNQWEITYVNHLSRGSVWNAPSDWGFFRPLAPIPTIPDVVIGESFAGEWHSSFPDNAGSCTCNGSTC